MVGSGSMSVLSFSELLEANLSMLLHAHNQTLFKLATLVFALLLISTEMYLGEWGRSFISYGGTWDKSTWKSLVPWPSFWNRNKTFVVIDFLPPCSRWGLLFLMWTSSAFKTSIPTCHVQFTIQGYKAELHWRPVNFSQRSSISPARCGAGDKPHLSTSPVLLIQNITFEDFKANLQKNKEWHCLYA